MAIAMPVLPDVGSMSVVCAHGSRGGTWRGARRWAGGRACKRLKQSLAVFGRAGSVRAQAARTHTTIATI
eukprot:353827-Chlamydomonas_euryale.AAC.7